MTAGTLGYVVAKTILPSIAFLPLLCHGAAARTQRA